MSARAAAGIAPARIWTVSTEATPRNINTPSPPPPMTAAITAVPILVTTAIRIPAMMVGAASGNSTIRNNCRSVIPMAIAASRTGASTFVIPTIVFRRTGSNEYKIKHRIAVCLPIPPTKGIGRRKPNSAKLGIVCRTLATANEIRRTAPWRVPAMPSPTPINMAIPEETATRKICSPVNSATSFKRIFNTVGSTLPSRLR